MCINLEESKVYVLVVVNGQGSHTTIFFKNKRPKAVKKIFERHVKLQADPWRICGARDRITIFIG